MLVAERSKWAANAARHFSYRSGATDPLALATKGRFRDENVQAANYQGEKAGLAQKELAEHLHPEDGRRVLPPFLNDLEHDHRYPPENAVIEQPADILNFSC